MTRKRKSKGGRPKIKLDWELIEGLCKLQCTHEEIAALARCSVDTLSRATRRERRMSFAEYFKEKAMGGRASLRQMQWASAKRGSVAAQIWLGKQYLGQRDQRDAPVGDPQSLARGVREMVGALFAVAQ